MPALRSIQTWAKESFPLDLDVLKEMSSEPIPYHLKRWWFAVGGTPLYLFVIQAVTGIMLTFYYVPEPAEAYNSVARITNEMPFGWYLRSIHKWSANLMVAAVILHMLRVFFTSAYRKPREFNWMIGAGLLLTSCVFGFTGYSLIYEQISYWAAVVGTNIAEATPLIGAWLANFARGGPEVGANTLTRFFVFHIGVLPTVMVILLVLHVVQIRLHGVTRLRFDERGEPGVGLSISVSAPATPMEFREGGSGATTKEEKSPTTIKSASNATRSPATPRRWSSIGGEFSAQRRRHGEERPQRHRIDRSGNLAEHRHRAGESRRQFRLVRGVPQPPLLFRGASARAG